MDKLCREDLYSLERYAEVRSEFRSRVMAHKQRRQVAVGPNATLYFEDRLTMQYQIQEILRTERIFEADGIQEELDAYNPLIPDGSNLKATFMIEYEDATERQSQLAKMIGIEDKVWASVSGFDRVWAIADEDMDRENDNKTSAVHFLRFELTAPMSEAIRSGAAIAVGIDHPVYRHSVDPLSDIARDTLADDLQATSR
ncbi:MAG: DUF3501 family protein [Gammaproteobacteria bacterium]|nr:DUF3501 family protein [Gammaproteobacteria bacterium]